MRAARKAGELSKKIEKASGNQYSKSASPDKPEKQKILSDAGISTQQVLRLGTVLAAHDALGGRRLWKS
jgi:hypothetical protein